MRLPKTVKKLHYCYGEEADTATVAYSLEKVLVPPVNMRFFFLA